jgi:hypothetical protein
MIAIFFIGYLTGYIVRSFLSEPEYKMVELRLGNNDNEKINNNNIDSPKYHPIRDY